MSVNIVTGLAEAYTALTGLETVQTATGIMVNNGGSWATADASTIYNVIKNGGCKAVGKVSHLNPNAWQIVDYAAKTGEFIYEGSSAITSEYMWSVPEQYAGNALVRSQTISNAGRAALQNGGAQLGTKVLQPVTSLEVVQSTGGTTALQTTSKGVLTKIPLKAAMRACAAAQGIMLGVEFVETNPELATKLSNAIFRTDIDPANIASIVENTTVWANIRDGAIFLTEDLINCIKGVFQTEGVFDQGSTSGAYVDQSAVNGSYHSQATTRITLTSGSTNLKALVVEGTLTKTSPDQVMVVAWHCYRISNGTWRNHAVLGSNQAFTFKAKYSNMIDINVEPDWSSIQFNERLTHLSQMSANYSGITNAEFDLNVGIPGVIVLKNTSYSTDSSDTVCRRMITNYFNGDTSLVVPTGPSEVAGTQKIPGSTYPTVGGSTATDYPDWWDRRIETLEGNNETGEIVPVPWLPVNIFQPTGDDPADYSQDDSQDGQVDDEEKITEIIDTFNDVLEDNEDDPDPDPDPDIYPNPNPTPDPTLVTPITPIPPIEDPSDGVSPDPTNPIITTAATSGLAHIYNPTLQQVQAVSRKLWTLDFLENLKKIFVDPMDGIIGFLIVYATPKTTEPEDIVLGVYNTEVQAKVVTNQYITIDCGDVTVNEFFKDARDYSPYTSVSLYLPFIGVVGLYADDVINSHVNIVYHVDVLTGTCLATVKVTKQGASAVIYQYPGNCAVQIPLTSMNYSAIVTSLFSIGISAVGGAALGTAKAVGRRVAGAIYGGAKSAAINAGSSQIDVQQSGSIGSNAGVMGIRKPYFIIRRPVINDAYGYPQQYGYPANKWVVLGTMRGFTRVKSIHLDSLVCTDEEKDMLDSLLKEGVVF